MILRKTLICHHYTILYRQVNKKKPANLLRPDSIIHTIAPCQDRMETVHGNPPCKAGIAST
jgi:hypothetical protein